MACLSSRRTSNIVQFSTCAGAVHGAVKVWFVSYNRRSNDTCNTPRLSIRHQGYGPDAVEQSPRRNDMILLARHGNGMTWANFFMLLK